MKKINNISIKCFVVFCFILCAILFYQFIYKSTFGHLHSLKNESVSKIIIKDNYNKTFVITDSNIINSFTSHITQDFFRRKFFASKMQCVAFIKVYDKKNNEIIMKITCFDSSVYNIDNYYYSSDLDILGEILKLNTTALNKGSLESDPMTP